QLLAGLYNFAGILLSFVDGILRGLSCLAGILVRFVNRILRGLCHLTEGVVAPQDTSSKRVWDQARFAVSRIYLKRTISRVNLQLADPRRITIPPLDFAAVPAVLAKKVLVAPIERMFPETILGQR